MTRQLEIKGTERKKIAQIELHAEAYLILKEKYDALSEKLEAAKVTLIDTMHVHQDDLPVDSDEFHFYRFDNVILTLKLSDNIKIKQLKTSDEGEE